MVDVKTITPLVSAGRGGNKPFVFGGYTMMMNPRIHRTYSRVKKRMEVVADMGAHFIMTVRNKNEWTMVYRVYRKEDGEEVGLLTNGYISGWEALSSSPVYFMGDVIGKGNSMQEVADIVINAGAAKTRR